MLSTPIKTNQEVSFEKLVAIASTPYQNMLDNVHKWQRKIELIKEENWFFRRLIGQAESISDEVHAKTLAKLRTRLEQFEVTELEEFAQMVRQQSQRLRAQKNSKYPPTQLGETYRADQALRDQYRQLRSRCDQLKRRVFHTVEDYIVISIY